MQSTISTHIYIKAHEDFIYDPGPPPDPGEGKTWSEFYKSLVNVYG